MAIQRLLQALRTTATWSKAVRVSCATVLLLLQLAWAMVLSSEVQAAELRDQVSSYQFKTLVRQCVAAVPDLQPLWTWQRKFNEPVYLGGGVLRGLLVWIRNEVAAGRPVSTLPDRVPSSEQLLLLPGSDRDIFHATTDRAWFQQNFTTYKDWDILTGAFAEASRAAGGSTIEKVRVNPVTIDDPWDAIENFRQGRLEFYDTPEITFAKFRSSASILNQNSKTALVLRHLRIARDMGITLEQAELEALRKIVDREYQQRWIPRDNYWIRKSLNKFRQALDHQPSLLKQSLNQVGLDLPLHALGYMQPNGDPQPLKAAAQIGENQVQGMQVRQDGDGIHFVVNLAVDDCIAQQIRAGNVRIEVKIGQPVVRWK